MRQRVILSLAIAGMFILASAAASRADWYYQSESSDKSTSEMTSPSAEPGIGAPEVGTFERQEPTEAGLLPPSERSMYFGNSKAGSPDDESVPKVEVGGLRIREGVDTGP